MERYDYRKLYNFYKTPDGDACLEKVYYATKYTSVFGLAVAAIDICNKSFPRTLGQGILRIAHFVLPLGAAGAMCATAICLSGQIRQTNDSINHLVGGIAFGIPFGVKFASRTIGCQVGIPLGLFLCFMKYCRDENRLRYEQLKKSQARYVPVLDWTVKMYDDPGRPANP